MRQRTHWIVGSAAVLALAPPALAQVQEWWVGQEGGFGLDRVTDMAVNPNNGNVYVTGYRETGSGTSEWITVAYSPDRDQFHRPDPLWQNPATYGGPAAGRAEPRALFVDRQNSKLYVVGHSPASGTGVDFVTIKYNLLNGQPDVSWPDVGWGVGVRRYNGPANSYDSAAAVGVDAITQSVFVTGPSTGSGTGLDFAILKYDSNGNLSSTWADAGFGAGVRRYNGPGNGRDEPVAISAGDHAFGGTIWLYVTGPSDGGPATKADYATLQIDQSTGQFGGSGGWATGIARYNGPSSGRDVPTAMARVSSGVVVTGSSQDLGNVAFGPLAAPDPPQPELDATLDYLTIFYTQASSTPDWVRRYNGPANGGDVPYAITAGSLFDGVGFVEYVWVTGVSQGQTTDWDIKTERYRTNQSFPDPGWPDPVGRFAGAGREVGTALALPTAKDALYVAGWTTSFSGNSDMITFKLDPHTAAVQPHWPVLYGPIAGAGEAAVRVALDGNNWTVPNAEQKVIVAGWAEVPFWGSLLATIRYWQEP